MKHTKISFIFFIIIALLLPLTSIATTLPEAMGNISTDNSENTNPDNSLNIENSKPSNTPNVGSSSTTTSIVCLSSKSVAPNTEFYLILNLANISYTHFKVEISNTANLTANTVTSTVSNLELNTNPTSFIVDKSLINLDKLGIVYTSPDQDTNIAFSVTITNLEVTSETLNSELQLLKTELTNLQTELLDLENKLLETDTESEDYQTITESVEKLKKTIEEKTLETETLIEKINNFIPETLEGKTTITVRKEVTSEDEKENIIENNKPWDDKNSLLEEIDKDKSKEMTSSMKKMMEEMSKLESNLKTANDTISSLTKTITYQGSQNNYLESLSISNVEFKNNFKKTTLNYFATVDENTNSVTVNAVPEDSSAIVTIYGNTNLQSGKNKVLITVTADDGSIKTYKIYITK